MINIAICDDNKDVCSQMENILFEYAYKKKLKIDVSVFFSGESFLDFLNQGNTFDLTYLDIEIGKINGVEVGKHIRKVMKNYCMEIVYISGNEGYERQLFDVQPLHFIPKPINGSIVIDDMKLAMERSKTLKGFFTYQKGYNTYKVPLDQVLYFESLNREMKIVTTTYHDTFYRNMDDVYLSVCQHNFLQIHRSYVINYNHAAQLKYSEIVMSNGELLPISRSRRSELRNFQLHEE